VARIGKQGTLRQCAINYRLQEYHDFSDRPVYVNAQSFEVAVTIEHCVTFFGAPLFNALTFNVKRITQRARLEVITAMLLRCLLGCNDVSLSVYFPVF
jgi:hypothetical protein